ncbi:Holliday junction resolvase RuvX [Ligilactobacillus sp. LYQ135]
MARIMGLDVGSKTVGVSVSDQLGWTAQGVEIVRINEDEEIFGLDRIVELAHQNDVVGFVIGLPKNMNNTSGPRVEAAKHYGEMLQQKLDLPIDYQDERLTTVEAQRMLIEEADASRKKRYQVIDKLAATLILQNYLDRKGKLVNLL